MYKSALHQTKKFIPCRSLIFSKTAYSKFIENTNKKFKFSNFLHQNVLDQPNNLNNNIKRLFHSISQHNKQNKPLEDLHDEKKIVSTQIEIKEIKKSTIKKFLSDLLNRLRNLFPHAKLSLQYNTGGEEGYDPDYNIPAIYVLLAINVIMFILICLSRRKQWVVDHFMLTAQNIRKHKYYTMLTSAFTHINVLHIFVNMLAFVSTRHSFEWLGRSGNRHIYLLYIAGAIVGSLFLMIEKQLKGRYNYT